MNYGMMLADSLIKNDGSEYAKIANDSLANALESAKASVELQEHTYNSAVNATNSIVNAIGTPSQTIKDKDGNVTTTPGTGFIGLAEADKDFAGRQYDLGLAINENTSEYKNQSFNLILEGQKEQYELMANNDSFKNLDYSIDNEINKTLAENNSNLNPGKVKAYLTNPKLINEAIKAGELTDADAVMLKKMQQNGMSESISQSNKMKLMKEYNDNGWLTEDNLFKLAKIRSEDPFAKSNGLSTIDIYAQLAAEQRAVRNQGNLTDDMFDLNYSVNRNLLDGNRAINNGKYGNQQVNSNANGNITNNSNIKANQANSNTTNTNDNANVENSNNTQIDSSDEMSKYVSNVTLKDDGQVQIEFTDEGKARFGKSQQSMSEFFNWLGEQTEISPFWEGVKDASISAAPYAIGGALGLSVKLGGAAFLRFAIPKVKSLAGIGADALTSSLGWFFNDALGVNGEEAIKRFNAESEAYQNIKSDYAKEISNAKTDKEKFEIKKKYYKQMKDALNNSTFMVNEETQKFLKSKGYDKELTEAFKSGDTKKLNELTDKISKDKDFIKISGKRNDLQTTKKGTAKLYGSRGVGGGIKASLIYSAVFAAGGLYDYFSNDGSTNSSNPDEATTYEDLEKRISSFTKSFEGGVKAYEEPSVNQEDAKRNFVSSGLNEELKNKITVDIDYSKIKENINKDFRNGKISQKEAQEQLAYVKRVEDAANAIWFEKDVQRIRDEKDPNSIHNILKNPHNANPDDLENSVEARAILNASKTQIPTVINKHLNGGNPHQKDGTEINPNSALILSSAYRRPIEGEVDIKGIKVPISDKLSASDKVSNNFFKIDNADEGTFVPISALIFKDKFVSILNSNDISTANFYKELKAQGLDEDLLKIDTFLQSGKKEEAYAIMQGILQKAADIAATHKPSGIAMKNNSSKVNNQDLIRLVNGNKDFSIDKLGNSLLNDMESGYLIQQELSNTDKLTRDYLNPLSIAYIFGDSKRTRGRINELKKARERQLEQNKKNKK